MPVTVAIAGRQLAISLVTANARRRIAEETSEEQGSKERRFLSVFQTRTIIGAAVIEGAAFLAAIAYMLERSPAVLGLAALLLLGVTMHFPTESRIISWVERESENLEMARRMGDR